VLVPNPLITRSPGRCSGTAVFAGTRVPVQILIEYLEAGDSLDDFLEDFPSVSREHAVAVLELAKQALDAQATAAVGIGASVRVILDNCVTRGPYPMPSSPWTRTCPISSSWRIGPPPSLCSKRGAIAWRIWSHSHLRF
jgi:uncharacterized protein (DUF433 family)